MGSVRAVKRKVARRRHRDDSDLFLQVGRRNLQEKHGESDRFLQKYLSRSLQNLDELYELEDDGEVELGDGSVASLPLMATTMTDNEQSDFEQDFSEPTRQPPVAQVLPNANHLDRPDSRVEGTPGRNGKTRGSPRRDAVMSPRARIVDGKEDVNVIGDSYYGVYDDNRPKLSNLEAEEQFGALELDYTLNQTDFVPNKTLMEVKDRRTTAGEGGPSQHAQVSHHSQHPHQADKSPLRSAHQPSYSSTYSGAQPIPSYHSTVQDYPQYPGYPVARNTGYPVPVHTKMNLAHWQQNLDSQLKLQQQMQHLHLNPCALPPAASGTGHSYHRQTVASYPLGDSSLGVPVMVHDTANLEGLIKAKENMLHERNIVIERQKLEIAHLQKQTEEQEAIARQRLYARSREDGDMLFLQMQEYQYEIASLRAQLAEVSTAKVAEGEQLSRKLGEVEYEMRLAQEAMKESQHTNEKTIVELKKQLRLREAEAQESASRLELGKRDYDKLKKRIGKMERYMHDLPTADEYKESTETIRSLRHKESILEQRIVGLESSLARARQKGHKNKMDVATLEDQNGELQLGIERMKREMSKLQQALGAKKTGDPTDLELCSREHMEQLRGENERHAINVDHLKKVIESKHKHLHVVQGEHQRALQEIESRLLQEEATDTALRVELKDKEQTLEEMRRSMKQLAFQSQELYDHNLSLQETIRTLDERTSSSGARFTGQLVKEVTQCVQELQQLVELCSQRAEGQEPNVSLLLGFRPSSAMSYEPGDDDEHSPSKDAIKSRLSQVQKLRADIDLLRSLISDKYAEDVGSNCITH